MKKTIFILTVLATLTLSSCGGGLGGSINTGLSDSKYDTQADDKKEDKKSSTVIPDPASSIKPVEIK